MSINQHIKYMLKKFNGVQFERGAPRLPYDFRAFGMWPIMANITCDITFWMWPIMDNITCDIGNAI